MFITICIIMIKYRHVLLQYRYFQSNDSEDSLLTVPIGNVKADTELSYGFGMKKDSTLRTRFHNKDHLVPFQLQVDHVLPDGSHMMRVFTKTLPVTQDKSTAEKCE